MSMVSRIARLARAELALTESLVSSRLFACLAAMATLLTSGVLYHLLAKDSTELDGAAARVALAPSAAGAWQAHDVTADEAAFAQAGAKSYWTRMYVHQETKASVLVILMCGRAGKMSVHSPEICYGGAGYELRGAPAICDFPTALGQDSEQFWTAHFIKKLGGESHLRLFWAWNARGGWEASSSPRWQFRGAPFLYKLYVSHDLGASPGSPPKVDPAADFLRAFLPELDRTLFPAAKKS